MSYIYAINYFGECPDGNLVDSGGFDRLVYEKLVDEFYSVESVMGRFRNQYRSLG